MSLLDEYGGDDKWEATITPPNHWWGQYYISYHCGLSDDGDGYVPRSFRWGRKRAEKAARKEIARRTREDERMKQRWTVT